MRPRVRNNTSVPGVCFFFYLFLSIVKQKYEAEASLDTIYIFSHGLWRVLRGSAMYELKMLGIISFYSNEDSLRHLSPELLPCLECKEAAEFNLQNLCDQLVSVGGACTAERRH